MSRSRYDTLRLTEKDLDFLVETTSPGVIDKIRLKEILREDEGFRNAFIEDEKVIRRVMDEEEIFLKISPNLFFEILLRKVSKDLKGASYTLEKMGTLKVPIFDAKSVAEFLSRESLLHYLADMLSSFTKVQTYVVSVELKEGTWEEIRFSDFDLFSLMALAEVADEPYRLGLYKRIADLCLFILGMFPDYAERDYRYPFSGQLRPEFRGKVRIPPDQYEKEGKKFYKLAAEHQGAKETALSEVFWALHEDFEKARKPLNFISDHYLRQRRQKLFG
jgi:hypothetical protein